MTHSIEIAIWLGSFLIAIFLSGYVIQLADYFQVGGIWVRPVFFAILIICFARLIFVWSDKIIASVPYRAHEHWSNRLAGLLPGLFAGAIYGTLLSFFFLSYNTGDPSNKTRESRIAGILSNEHEMPGSAIAAALRSIGYNLGSSLTIHPSGSQSVPLPFKSKRAKVRRDLEREMLAYINSERAKSGLPGMQLDEPLSVVARKHSADMVQRGYFSHYSLEGVSPFDRIRREGLRFGSAGENLAFARDLKLAHEGLMESPVHRANILNPLFGRAGIGVMDAGIHGLVITQNFRN